MTQNPYFSNPSQPQQQTKRTNPYLPSGGYSPVLGQEQEEEKEQGFIDWSGNVLRNTATLLFTETPRPHPNDTFGQSTAIAWNDFKNWFSNASFTANDAKDAVKGLVTLPFSPSRWGQVAKGLGEIPVSFVESLSGQNLGDNDYTPLTPDQRAERIKNAIGGAIAAAVTYGASKGLNAIEAAAFTPKAAKLLNEGTIASAATTADLAMAKPALGPLARGFIKGTIESGIAGASYTAVARAGEEDIGASIIMNGLIFAPIGGAFHLYRTSRKMSKGILPEPEMAVAKAKELAFLRGLQFTQDQSFAGTVNNVGALSTTKSLAQAFVEGKLVTDPSKAYVFEGITKVDINDVLTTIREKAGQGTANNIALYSDENNLISILFGGKNDISKARPIFEATGQAEGKIVSYKGKDYKITDIKAKGAEGGKNLTIQSLEDSGITKKVKASSVESKPNSIFEVEKLTPDKYVNQLFTNWANTVIALSSNKSANLQDAHFANPVSYRGVLAKVATQMGFPEKDVPLLAQKVESKLHEYLKKNMPDEDREWITAAEKHLGDYQKKLQDDLDLGVISKSEHLNEQAFYNGLFIDTESAGVINIRSTQDGRSIGKATTIPEALEYIRNSGQAETYTFGDDLKALPPNVPAPVGVPTYKEAWNPVKKNAYLGTITDQLRARMSILFTAGDNIKAIDNIFGSKLYESVFQPTQKVITEFYAKNHNMENSLKPLDSRLSKLSADRVRVISGYADTMSPEDLALKGVIRGRPLSPEVIEHGKWLADNDIDVGKIYETRRMIENNPTGAQALIQALGPKEQEALLRFDSLSGKGKSDVSLYETTRYAQALRNKEGNRSEYATKNGMSREEINLGDEVLNQFEYLRTQFQLDDVQTLNSYFNHYRNFAKRPDSKSFNQILLETAGPKTAEFVGEMARIGQLDSFLDNPIDLLRAYIKTGNKVNILNPVIKAARKALEVELGTQYGDGGLVVNEKKVNAAIPRARIESYLDELVGIPNSSSQFSEAALEATNGIWKLSKDHLDKIARYTTGTVELSTQGLRPGQGVRDLYSGWANHFVRFGLSRSRAMMKYFADDKLADSLLKQGHIIGLDINQFVSAGGLFDQTGIKGSAARGFDKALKVGFEGSLQKPVHVRLQAATFMETFKNTEEVLLKLSRSKITKEQAYKKLLLTDAYDPSVAKAFDTKVTAGKFYEAAHMLAQETARETIGQYGAAYHPYKWNTTTGRLMGQFGQWASMELGYFMRISGQGSLGYRFSALKRWSAAQGALYVAEKTLGINLSSWYLTPQSMLFGGSPLLQAGFAGISTLTASDYERKQGTQTLTRLIPFADENRIAQVYLPFSFATRDLIRAVDDFSRGYYLQSPLQAIGIPTNQKPGETGLIDSMLGNRPRPDY